jgi:hypothetical protein
MDSSSLAIKIIPDLTIDEKYSAIISDAQGRVDSFVLNAMNGGRVGELFDLERTRLNAEQIVKVLKAEGKLHVGFQFEAQPDAMEENFRVFTKKVLATNKKSFKLYLTPTVQEIMLQLISLEDRRTLAIFSMLNSSLDVGYRILTTLYGNQLKRLYERAPAFIRDGITTKLDRLKVAKVTDADQLWEEAKTDTPEPGKSGQADTRAGSEDNILQVMTDESVFAEINQYVENIVSRTDRIRSKRKRLEENPDIPRPDMYEQMIKEDFSQLENCYARIHIYLKAFYKNQPKRNSGKNAVLRQFFAGEIENITGETSLLEDLLSLSEPQYFANIDRHQELESTS